MKIDPTANWLPLPANPIPMERFGKDHWSTFAYLETVIVDGAGPPLGEKGFYEIHGRRRRLNHDRMRCDAVLHPWLASAKSIRISGNYGPCPTRIKKRASNPDGTWPQMQVDCHDDYSCIADMVVAGLVLVHMPVPDPGGGDFYVDRAGRKITRGLLNREDPPQPSFLTGLGEGLLQRAAEYELTQTGWRVSHQLRQWKAAGGNFANFMPKEAT